MGRINSTDESPESENKLFKVLEINFRRREDLKESIMALCDGDAVQYEAIRFGSVDLFLIKLTNFASKIEAKEKDSLKGLPV